MVPYIGDFGVPLAEVLQLRPGLAGLVSEAKDHRLLPLPSWDEPQLAEQVSACLSQDYAICHWDRWDFREARTACMAKLSMGGRS